MCDGLKGGRVRSKRIDSRGRLDMTLRASAHVETMVSRSQGWALHFAL